MPIELIDCKDYDMSTSLGTAKYFTDVLESMIGESWFRNNYSDIYEKSCSLCKDMRRVVESEHNG